MDLSKLPKMSQTPPPPPPPADPAPDPGVQRPVPDYQPVSLDAGVGGAIWISVAIGLLLMLMGGSFARYLAATVSGKGYNTGYIWPPGHPKGGQPVGYWELDSQTGWSDAGIFIFGSAMVLEGIMLATLNSRTSTRTKILVVIVALVLCVLATVLNLYAAVRVFGAGFMPLWSALAVAFGVYMVMYEWKLLRILKGKPIGMS